MCVPYASKEYKCENCSQTVIVTERAFRTVFEDVKTCITCASNMMIRSAYDLGTVSYTHLRAHET